MSIKRNMKIIFSIGTLSLAAGTSAYFAANLSQKEIKKNELPKPSTTKSGPDATQTGSDTTQTGSDTTKSGSDTTKSGKVINKVINKVEISEDKFNLWMNKNFPNNSNSVDSKKDYKKILSQIIYSSTKPKSKLNITWGVIKFIIDKIDLINSNNKIVTTEFLFKIFDKKDEFKELFKISPKKTNSNWLLDLLDEDKRFGVLKEIVFNNKISSHSLEILLNFLYNSKVLGKKLSYWVNPVYSGEYKKILTLGGKDNTAAVHLYNFVEHALQNGLGLIDKNKLLLLVKSFAKVFEKEFNGIKKIKTNGAKRIWLDTDSTTLVDNIHNLLKNGLAGNGANQNEKDESLKKSIDSVFWLYKLIQNGLSDAKNIDSTKWFQNTVLSNSLGVLLTSGFKDLTEASFEALYTFIFKGPTIEDTQFVVIKDKFTKEFVKRLAKLTYQISHSGFSTYEQFKSALTELPFGEELKIWSKTKLNIELTNIFELNIADIYLALNKKAFEPKYLNIINKNIGETINDLFRVFYNGESSKVTKLLYDVVVKAVGYWKSFVVAPVAASMIASIGKIVDALSLVLKKGIKNFDKNDFKTLINAIKGPYDELISSRLLSLALSRGLLSAKIKNTIQNIITKYKNALKYISLESYESSTIYSKDKLAMALYNIYNKGIARWSKNEWQLLWNIMRIKYRLTDKAHIPIPSIIKTLFIDGSTIITATQVNELFFILDKLLSKSFKDDKLLKKYIRQLIIGKNIVS